MPRPNPAFRTRLSTRRWFRALAMLGIALLLCGPIVLRAWGHIAEPGPPPRPSWDLRSGRGTDLDTLILHGGLVRHPTLASTLTWWAGPWVGADVEVPGQPGQHVVFYRPVPSVLFWAEWRLFGDDERPYGALSLVLLVVDVALLAATARRLYGEMGVPRPTLTALLTVWGFATGFDAAVNPLASTTLYALAPWKNLPDLLALFFLLIALLGYVRARRDEMAAWGDWRWIVPLYFACAGKEIVLLSPLLLVVLELALSRRAGTRRRIGLAVGFLLLFNLFRLAVLHGTAGYRYGTPNYFREALGDLYPFGEPLVMRDHFILVLAALVLAAWLVDRVLARREVSGGRRFVFALAWPLLAVGAGCAFVDRDGMDTTATITASLAYVAQTFATRWAALAALALAPLAIVAVARRAPGVLAFSLAWTVLCGVPNLFSQAPPHRFFVPNVGTAMLYGTGLALMIEKAWSFLSRPGWDAAIRP